ncbi:hypothetical protein SVAN01_03079 [Stagonosporopsis vannaccii]|nr:hypothetical protein SVAN01_03079 [Stagonosporopsis vannaccii]
MKPVQRLIGLHQWEDNTKLSDVIIRFGDGPDDIFHGHRVILASSSFWFYNAFLGPEWEESTSREIRLHGDDPTALHLVLRALYLPENKYHPSEPWLDRSAAEMAKLTLSKRAVFSISVWQVADKYDCPNVKRWAGLYANKYLAKALDWARSHPGEPHLFRLTGLVDVVQAVYNATGHRAAEVEPLRIMLLKSLLLHPATSPLGVQDVLRAEVWRVAHVVPQFGADMFVVTTRFPDQLSVVAKLQVVEKVVCSACHVETWVARNGVKGRCDSCGAEQTWGDVVVPSTSAPAAQAASGLVLSAP